MPTEFYQVKWSWPKDVDVWLARRYKGKYLLNFPCGMSKIGDVRADIDPRVKPDIICDLKHSPFRRQSFDVVIVDPPFSMFNKFKWLLQLTDIARNVIIISGLPFSLHFKHFKLTPFISRTPGMLFARIWQEFTRKQKTLDKQIF